MIAKNKDNIRNRSYKKKSMNDLASYSLGNDLL